MWVLRLRRGFGAGLFFVSAAMLVWGIWPARFESRQVEIPAGDLRLPGGSAQDDRRLIVSWPASARIGDPWRIRLDLIPIRTEEAASTGAVDAERQPTVAARLELPGVRYFPPGETSQVLTPGRPLRYSWMIYPEQSGEITATIWLHLADPADSQAQDARAVISAQRLSIQAGTFLGIGGRWARSLGGAGALIGALLGFDGLVEKAIKLVREKAAGHYHA